MHDEKLQKAIDQFVLERINACGQMENQAVADAYALFSEKADELKQSLSSRGCKKTAVKKTANLPQR